MNTNIKTTHLNPGKIEWMFMSPQKRYSCLWNRTKKMGDLGFNGLNHRKS
jgi:hypothetical protein